MLRGNGTELERADTEQIDRFKDLLLDLAHQGVGDRQLHVRAGDMRRRRAVGEIDHGVDHRTGLDDGVVLEFAEKPARLEQFEELVHHRGAVDRDLLSHRPVGVLERVRKRRRSQLFDRPVAKRPAAGGDGHLFYRPGVVEQVPQPEMFAVDGMDARRVDKRPRRHQRLLVRQGDSFAGFKCFKRRTKPQKSHKSIDDKFGIRFFDHP